MSDAELTKFEILRDVDLERLPVRAAARTLDLSERQVWRLLKAFRTGGASGLISKRRGQPSNRRTPAEVRLAAMSLIRARYADFGPTLAAEKLRELHDLTLSRETLRAWMIAEGLWQNRRKRRGKPSNRSHGATFRQTCLAIVRERYEDFGLTLVAEKRLWAYPCTMQDAVPARAGRLTDVGAERRRALNSGRSAEYLRRIPLVVMA